MAEEKNLKARLTNEIKSLPQIYDVPDFVIDWAKKRMKDLTREAEAIIKKLRGGFGSFGEISDENDKKFCYGDIEDFINKANHYIEEHPEEKNKIRKMIKNIEKEVIDLKACNIISKDIDFRKVGNKGYSIYDSYDKKYKEILAKIKDFEKQHKKTKIYVRGDNIFTTKQQQICQAYKTNIEKFKKQLKCEESFFDFDPEKKINEKIRKKFEYKNEIVVKKITGTTKITSNDKECVTQFDPFQAINDSEIFNKEVTTYSQKIKSFLSKIINKIIEKYELLAEIRNEKLNTKAKKMTKTTKSYKKDATKLLSGIESFFGELCKFLNNNKSFVKELEKQNIEYKKIYDCYGLIKEMKLDIDKTFTEYVYRKSANFFDANYAKELTNIKFYLQDCEKLIDDFCEKVKNSKTKFKDLKNAAEDLYDKYKGLDTITSEALEQIVANGSQNEKDDHKVETELESKLKDIQTCCTKIKDFSRELQEMKNKFDDSQKPQKKALKGVITVFRKISQFAFIGYKACSVASGNIGNLKDIVDFIDNLTSDYLNTNFKK